MNFISFEFVGFLGAVYVLHWMLPQARARNWLLTGASYLFYAAWDRRFCLLMLFVTVNAFGAGLLVSRLAISGRKPILPPNLAIILPFLSFFKYFTFFS